MNEKIKSELLEERVSRFIGFYRVSRPSRVNGIEPDLHRGDPCFGTSIQEQTQEADEVQQPLCMLATASGMEHSRSAANDRCWTSLCPLDKNQGTEFRPVPWHFIHSKRKAFTLLCI